MLTKTTLFFMILSAWSAQAQEVTQARVPCSQYPDVVDEFLASKPNFHHYFVESEICTTDEFKSATRASVFAILLKQNYYVAPTFNNKPVMSCGKVNADISAVISAASVKPDPIFTLIDDVNFSVTNYTMNGHILHAGKVVREIIQRGKRIIIRTRGIGNNKNKIYAFINGNQTSMEYIWETVDATFIKEARMRLKVLNPQPTSSTKRLATFSWRDGCDYKGVYDANKYSALQLSNTLKLRQDFGGLDVTKHIIALPPGSTLSISSMATLDADYQRKMNWLNTAEFLPNLFWQQYKNRAIRELEQSYQAYKIGILYNSYPSILRDNRFSFDCEEYVEPLVSSNPSLLLRTWLQLTKKQIDVYKASPELMSEYQKQFDSPDRLGWAKYNIMMFGWWNLCANARVEHITLALKGQALEEYTKLFTKISESNCDY